MAESAVGFAVANLIPALIKEAIFQKELCVQVQKISDDLVTIQSYLREADQQAEKDVLWVKDWVRRVRELGHRIEDVIDEYRFQVAKLHHQRQIKFFTFIRDFVIRIKPSHKLMAEIKEIRSELTELRTARNSMGLLLGRRIEGEANNEQKLHPQHLETQFVGIESPTNTFVARLIDDSPNRKIIAVVGPPGLGKSTLVRNVSDHRKVRRTFQCQLFVEVGLSYNLEVVFKKFIKQLQKDMEPIPDADKLLLIDEAREYLRTKRYLVIFDNVWDSTFWEKIQSTLPPNEKGSRVIITTRKKEVVQFCKRSVTNANEVELFNLEPLKNREAKLLFYQKVFQGRPCPDSLKKLSSDIVRRCGGNPMAIVAIGSLLSDKTEVVEEWQRAFDELGSNLENHNFLKSFNGVLSHSYYELSYALKLCFLYFSIFPEGHHINCKRLVRLWISEGFVEESSDSLEDVGMGYLKELMNRSLVEVSWADFDGEPRSCRVHNIMHSYILEKARQINFCKFLCKGSKSSVSPLPRRLAIFENYLENEVVEGINKNVKSCLLFGGKGVPISFITTFRLLKTLDFEDSPLDVLPEEIGSLLLLKFLSVRNTKAKFLPKSIGKLQELFHLDLKNSQVRELPLEINNLVKLHHLLGYSFNDEADFGMASFQGFTIKEGFGHLQLLRKLYFIDMSSQEAHLIIRELKKLKNIKKLGIKKLQRQHGRGLCSVLETMTSLHTLRVGSLHENELLELGSLSHPPENLRRLYLEGYLISLPEWIPKLKNLVRLHLSWSRLEEDPVTALKHLHELLDLSLHGAYQGQTLHFKEGSLKKLKILCLRNLQQLQLINIDEGSLVELKKLYIGLCPQMKEVPNDLRYLKNLRILRFYEMDHEFTRSLGPMQQNNYKIQHVPCVTFVDNQGRNAYSNSLHYADITKNKYGDDYEISAILGSSQLEGDAVSLELPEVKKELEEDAVVHGSDDYEIIAILESSQLEDAVSLELTEVKKELEEDAVEHGSEQSQPLSTWFLVTVSMVVLLACFWSVFLDLVSSWSY